VKSNGLSQSPGARWRRCLALSLAFRLLARIVLLDLEVFFVWASDLDEISLFLAGIGLQTRSFSRPAIGISRKLIAVNSLIQKP
jgi:hypothetical protein